MCRCWQLRICTFGKQECPVFGNPRNFFPNMYEAGKVLGINSRSIGEVANGQGHLLRGSFWRFGKITRKT
jgi:hypothetical protein